VISQQELKVERFESSQSGFVERIDVDNRLSLSEKLVVGFPENCPLRSNGFETLPMEMMSEFTYEFVQLVEITIELIALAVRPDETAVAKPLKNTVDSVAIVVTPVGDLGNGTRLIRIIQQLEWFPGQQLGKLDMGVLTDEGLIDVDGSGVRGNDSLSATVAFRIHVTILAKIRNGTGEIAPAVTKLRREL